MVLSDNIEADRIESIVSDHDLDVSFIEGDIWREDQKAYYLTGEKRIYLSSIGEGDEGVLTMMVLHKEDEEGDMSAVPYESIIKITVNLFDDTLDTSQIYRDFTETDRKEEEKKIEWIGTYQNIDIIVWKNTV